MLEFFFLLFHFYFSLLFSLSIEGQFFPVFDCPAEMQLYWYSCSYCVDSWSSLWLIEHPRLFCTSFNICYCLSSFCFLAWLPELMNKWTVLTKSINKSYEKLAGLERNKQHLVSLRPEVKVSHGLLNRDSPIHSWSLSFHRYITYQLKDCWSRIL